MLFRRKKPAVQKLFISVGTGANQVPLIEEAVRLGFHVVGIDRNINSAGSSRCYMRIQESIDNYREIAERLREICIFGEIRGVMSKSYGTAVKTACYLAEEFRIPLIPFNRIDDFISKKRMKSVFLKNGIPTPPHVIIDPKGAVRKLPKYGFPAVIKPLTGHAKTDVALLTGKSELAGFLSERQGKNTAYIMEQYCRGDEIIAAGIVHNMKFYLASVSDKTTTRPPFFVDLRHDFPSRHMGLWNRIAETGQAVTNAFELINTPLIMEMIVGEDGSLSVIEAVPEFGGEHLPDYLIPEGTGYNFISEAIRAATGEGFRPPVEKKVKKAVVVKYITGFDENAPVSKPPLRSRLSGIVFSAMFKKSAIPSQRPSTNHDRLGVVITRGKTRDAALALAEHAAHRLLDGIREGAGT